MPMGNYVIGVSNYVIANRSTLGNSVIVHSDRGRAETAIPGQVALIGRQQTLLRRLLARRLRPRNRSEAPQIL